MIGNRDRHWEWGQQLIIGDMKYLQEYQLDVETGEYAEVTESQRSNGKPVAGTCPSPSP